MQLIGGGSSIWIQSDERDFMWNLWIWQQRECVKVLSNSPWVQKSKHKHNTPLCQVQQTVSWGSESLMRAATKWLRKETQGPEVSPTAHWWWLPDACSALESTDDKWSDQDNRFLLVGGSSQSFSAWPIKLKSLGVASVFLLTNTPWDSNVHPELRIIDLGNLTSIPPPPNRSFYSSQQWPLRSLTSHQE